MCQDMADPAVLPATCAEARSKHPCAALVLDDALLCTSCKDSTGGSGHASSGLKRRYLLSPSAVMPAWEKPRMAPKRLQLR